MANSSKLLFHYTRLMAQGAGKNVAGIYGTTNWHWSLENVAGSRYVGTNAFVQSFGAKYGFPPSQAAHTTYCQTLLYADACQRADIQPMWRSRSSC